MQEQLTRHQVEREVMEGPSENTHADLVVETLECDVAVVAVAALPAKDCDTLDSNVESNERARAPPNHWVTQKVDLTVVLAPEVDTAA